MDGHASCHGCDLCLLACPVWRETRDFRLTPHGRAVALQHGAAPADLKAAIAACTLCGSCEPACPEEIPLVELMLELRRAQPLEGADLTAHALPQPEGDLFLPGIHLDNERALRIAAILGVSRATDDGADIASALERGAVLPPARLSGFLDSLKSSRKIVVGDGLLFRKLKEWLPEKRVEPLGEAMSGLEAVRSKLRESDLYVIEPRAFHADHARLVRHYDKLRTDVRLVTNLDLQRLAVPVGAGSLARVVDPRAQAAWIIEGRRFERIVVEDAADCDAFASVTDRPVLHVGDL